MRTGGVLGEALQCRGHSRGHGLRAVVVEAHTIDHGAILDQAEQPRTGIARLTLARDRADLHVAEAEVRQRVSTGSALVETRGQTEWGREREPHDMDLVARIRAGKAVQHPPQAHTAGQLDPREPHGVGEFRVHPGENEIEESGVHAHGASFSHGVPAPGPPRAHHRRVRQVGADTPGRRVQVRYSLNLNSNYKYQYSV